ncbi:MAG: hypothetical protein ACLFNS_09895 [Desulfobacterales bacterium]
MKKTVLIMIALLAVTLMLIPEAFAKGAGNGSGATYHGQGFAERTCYGSENAGGAGRTGTCRMIETGEPMEISGTVAEVCTAGQGLKIDTGDAVVTVYGIGPVRYWADEGVARPTTGEEVVINAVEVTFSDGSTKIIATDMTVSGETIDLRNEAGLPLWRGGNSQRVQKRDCLE